MNLGAAIAVAFLVMGICAVLFVFLAIWLFRKGKKSEAAANAYNILALFTGGIIFTILGIIIFVLPQPFSYRNYPFQNPKLIAYNDSLMWMLDHKYDYGAAENFGIYNMNTNELTIIDTIRNEEHFFLNTVSVAWNGKILGVTLHGFNGNFLVASSGKKSIHKERLPSDFRGKLSSDQKTRGFILAGTSGTFSDKFVIRKYDNDFKEVSSDTFHLDFDQKRISSDCDEFMFIGNEWYANSDDQTFRIKLSGDTCRFEPFTAKNDSLFLLEGSMQFPRPSNHDSIPFHYTITSRGIQKIAYPRWDYRYLFNNSQPYYFISHDTISLRNLFEYRIAPNYQREEFQREGPLTLKIHHPAKRQTAEYEISGADSSSVSFYVFDGGRKYEYETNLIRNNKLEIYTHGDMYAAFDLISEERIDEVSWKERIKARFDNSESSFVPWLFYPAVFVFPFLLLGIIISYARKKSGKTTFKMYPYSLIYFLFIGLPFLIFLLVAMKGR